MSIMPMSTKYSSQGKWRLNAIFEGIVADHQNLLGSDALGKLTVFIGSAASARPQCHAGIGREFAWCHLPRVSIPDLGIVRINLLELVGNLPH
ncbi:MAG: hypothetical protein KAS85_02480 [Rhodobacteraceae bacterium]|nr:hypothetical protein [Paracoccaceae bacterium]